jgi:arylsulfatase A-like enzyme
MMRLIARFSLLLLGAALVSLCGCQTNRNECGAHTTRKPNVLLLICDDLNTDIEGYDAQPAARTPNMARLADSGLTFRQAHCTAPICAPSRASFLTGLYPHTSGNYGFDKWYDNEVLKNSRTIMDYFRMNGYRTLGTGKIMHQELRGEWDDWGNDADYGPFAFDGQTNVAHPFVPPPMRDEFGRIDGSFGPLVKLDGRVFPDGRTYSWRTGSWQGMRPFRVESDNDRDLTPDELNRDWAVNKLKELARAPGDKPFFMAVGFIRPHTPMIVPQRLFDMYPPAAIELPVTKPGDVEDTFLGTVGATEQGDLDRGAKIYENLVASYGSRDAALRQWIQAYLAGVTSDDEHLGRILDVIDHSPLRENTIIVLTSDHGFQQGQKDYVYKNSLWEESTRVPLIIRMPGVTKGGRTSHPVSLVDLYPTLADLCGLTGDTRKNSKGRPLDGHSLKPFLLDPEAKTWAGPDAALTTLFRWQKTYIPSEQSYALRSKDWRYIRYSNGREELYDHENDPYEWTNLAGDPQYAGKLEAFRAELMARLPKDSPLKRTGQKTEAKTSGDKSGGESWKDKYFKQHPEADANKDGFLTWPEYQAHKKTLEAGGEK